MTIEEHCRRKGSNYRHPLGRLAIVGGMIELFPPGSYVNLTMQCPRFNTDDNVDYRFGWFMADGMPPRVGSKIPWLCICDNAEKIKADVNMTLIVRGSDTTVLDGVRPNYLPPDYKTINMDDYLLNLET